MAEATVSAAGLKIVKLMVGSPPCAVNDLVQAAGVTRTAVTEQLNELMAAGFVEQSAERLPGRGRPRHLYKATNDALVLLFSSGQRIVVPAIWKAVCEIGGEELKGEIRKRVSRIMADHYNGKVTAKKPEERLRQLMSVLIDEGGILEAVNEEGNLVIYKRTCPFFTMVDEDRTICSIDLDMMSQVVGRQILRTACRHDGDPCCKIAIQK
jgi:predicted ArsR family transcriptional regulator